MYRQSGQALTDLQKAIALDKDEWRYYKLLGEYYIDHNENEKALEVVAPFNKAHSKNYIIGILYAKTLLLNKHYDACADLLMKINILPFEGATIGRELYHEAEVMQAINEMKKGNYTNALSFISKGKQWPQNLGVGKPYPENIDERLEDWMSYLCYIKDGQPKEAEQSLQKVLDFNPKIENTVINFFLANKLVTAWALEKLKSKTTADEWLQEEVTKYPGNKIIQWCRQVFNGEKAGIPDTTDSGTRLIESLTNLQQ